MAHVMWDDTGAACKPYGNGLWFSDDPNHIAAARSICLQCPIQATCREHGRREPHGMWGGQTPEQRGQAGLDLPAPRWCPHCRLLLDDSEPGPAHSDCETNAAAEARKQSRAEVSAARSCERCGCAMWPQARACLVCRHIVGHDLPNRPWPTKG